MTSGKNTGNMTLEEIEIECRKHRSERMLTVKDLIAYLKTCDPDGCILGYEVNSAGWIEQMKDLPNGNIETVREAKKHELEYLTHAYRGCENAEKRVRDIMDEEFRYAEDNDVIIRF